MWYFTQKTIIALLCFILPTCAIFASDDLDKAGIPALYYKKDTPDQHLIEFIDGIADLTPCSQFHQNTLIFTTEVSCFLQPRDPHRIAILFTTPSIASSQLAATIDPQTTKEDIVVMWRRCFRGEAPFRQLESLVIHPSDLAKNNLYQIWRQTEMKFLLSSYVFVCGAGDFTCAYPKG